MYDIIYHNSCTYHIYILIKIFEISCHYDIILITNVLYTVYLYLYNSYLSFLTTFAFILIYICLKIEKVKKENASIRSNIFLFNIRYGFINSSINTYV